MICIITDTGDTLDCQTCGRKWAKLPPTGAARDCFPMLMARVQRYEAALRKIAEGDPNQVHSPIGPLHAAGIVLQWEIDAKICREALGETAS